MKKAWLASLLFAAGCASSADIRLTASQAKIRVTNNPAASAGCRFLAMIYTRKDATEGYREKQLHIEAEKLGANLVWYDDNEKKRGEAYRCEEPKP